MFDSINDCLVCVGRSDVHGKCVGTVRILHGQLLSITCPSYFNVPISLRLNRNEHEGWHVQENVDLCK